ncbi:MAG: hypothetical protein BroJett022_05040 [Actinomycetes bacterium]|nr:MAG: hypothetical protein BroJett022_05040 [Actinomycetes bacterium]
MASAKRRKRRRRRARAGASGAPTPEGETTPRPAPPPRRRRAAADEPPPPPWGSFPLIELSVLAGIVMLILGFFVVGGDRGPILIAAGLALGSIGGLELSIREHLAGYRSHTVVLAGVPALIVLGLLFYLAPEGLPALGRAAIGLAVFAGAAALLVRLFSRRSGGARYRFAPFRGRR